MEGGVEKEEILLTARYGEIEEFRVLLPLFLASSQANCDDKKSFTKILGESVIDPYSGNTVIHMAAANGHDQIISFVASLASPISDEEKSQETLNLFNVKNKSGNTALHYACLNGHLEVAKVLLQDCFADPLALNDAGRIPFDEALSNNHPLVKSLLVSYMEKIEESTSKSQKEQDLHNNTKSQERTEINEKFDDLNISSR